LDTSWLLSQALHLRDTDREHRAKVCVLAPLIMTLFADLTHGRDSNR
jgi:hypothetical protein